MKAAPISVFVALFSVACINTEPIEQVPPPPFPLDGGPTLDAAPDAPSALDGCIACMKTACPSAWPACEPIAKCASLFECGVDHGCYKSGADITSCMTPCATSAGVLGMDDPVIGVFVGPYTCARGTCASACAP